MLLLLFYIEDSLYAIDTAQVIEIVPLVVLQKVPHLPDYIAGVFNYRGQLIPVVDLCYLIRGTPCQACYSTRIIMFPQVGLMAERVTETLHRPAIAPQRSGSISTAPYLGELFMDQQGIIQQINWEPLALKAHDVLLFTEGRTQRSNAHDN